MVGRRLVGKGAGLKSVCLYVFAPLEGIYQMMQLQAGPDSVLLQSDDELQDFTNHQEASIIGESRPLWSLDPEAPVITLSLLLSLCLPGVFPGSDVSRLPEFLAAAALLREQFRFGHSNDATLCERHQAKAE